MPNDRLDLCEGASVCSWGMRADSKEAINLLKNLDAKLVFAGRAYGTNEILSYLARRNIKSVIPPKRNRFEQRDDKGFRVLKKRDSSLTVNFIALDILSKILSWFLNVGAASPPDTLKHSMVSSLHLCSLYLCVPVTLLNFFHVDSI